MHSDGSSLGNPGRSGSGVVFRDGGELCLMGLSGFFGIFDVLEAEIQGIL